MITMKDVIYDPHPLLRKISNKVQIPLVDEDIELMRKMEEFLINSQNPKTARKYKLREGVGLAAPQINKDKRIIAIRVTDEKNELHECVIANPKIISHSEELAYLDGGEGCLSVKKNIPGIVPRYRRIIISGYDINNNPIQIKAKNYIAIVFQHEMDHLDGKLFYDRINKNNPMMPPANAHAITF